MSDISIFADKNILLISPEPWSETFVSKHHYAVELAKHNKVFFLNPPSSRFNKKITVYKNITVIDYISIVRANNFLPLILIKQLEFLQFKILEIYCGFKFNVVWNFETSRFYNFMCSKDVLKILHIVDLNQDFHFKEASSSADICFCTTNFIKNELIKYNALTFKIGHGYSPQSEIQIDKVLPNNKVVNVGYVGVISIKYFDWKLFTQLVNRFKNVNFHLIGPLFKEKMDPEALKYASELEAASNVTFIGSVPKHHISSYLKLMDILLVTYKSNEFKEQLASPHKFMDYLASGKVIVSTYTDEYKDKSDLVLMNYNNFEFLETFHKVVNNLEFYNSVQLMTKRIKFALDNTYPKQLDRIEKLVAEKVL